jgi:hypothetical protein
VLCVSETNSAVLIKTGSRTTGYVPTEAQINESVPVSGNANTDGAFRYDSASKQYFYNLSTKTYLRNTRLKASVLINGKIVGFTEFGLK